MNDKKTSELLNTLNSIDNYKSLKTYISKDLDVKELTISEYLVNLCNKKGISKSTLIANADIDRTYGYQILNGSKNPSRNNIVKLCLSLQLTLDETDRALTIAKEGKLYPKVIRDTFLIFAINNKLSVLDTNILLEENGAVSK